MVTSLAQFRVQYPSAALVSDLVSTDNNRYVVRTAIVQKGETIATGLAASDDVQTAEDKARDRAIALLGLSTANAPSTAPAAIASPTPPTPPTKLTVVKPAQPSAAIPPSPSKPSEPTAAASTALQTDIASIEPDTEIQFEPDEVPPLPPEEDFGPPIDAIEEGPTETEKASSVPKPPAKPSAASIAMENLSASANPVDLSDVIAQTDVELTRLGWSSTQGREYLEKTYGKRSRQQLTDDELMSFLLYLEDQS
ncbi:MAG: hypothetical protein AAFN38_15205 [Cyanobacteria bacterium J06560_5]